MSSRVGAGIVTISKPKDMTWAAFQIAVRHISREAVIGFKDDPHFVCFWDTKDAPKPTDQDLRDKMEAAIRAHLKDRLDGVAARKRDVAAQVRNLERRNAQIGKALSILTKVAEGHIRYTSYNPIQDGVVTRDDIQFMQAVRDRGNMIVEVDTVSDAIEADIEAGVIADPDADLSGDPRWPV